MDKEQEPGRVCFTDFLTDMRNGKVLIDCSAKLNEVLDAILRTGGKGELIVKLMIKPSRANQGNVVEIEALHQCTAKIPEVELGSSIFFPIPGGGFTRTDPEQAEMFAEVEMETK